jgi:hypothetical protein
MNFAMRDNPGIQNQRGFWLRCFLGRACLAMAVMAAVAGLAWGKVEPAGPLHLWSLHGFYMTPAGKPIENAEIALQRDGKVVDKITTDVSGRFAFDHIHGRYTLHIDKSSNYSLLSREVIVGLEAAMMLRNNTLYIVAGPGACTDDCSSVYTSKYEFEKAVHRNTEHRD